MRGCLPLLRFSHPVAMEFLVNCAINPSNKLQRAGFTRKHIISLAMNLNAMWLHVTVIITDYSVCMEHFDGRFNASAQFANVLLSALCCECSRRGIPLQIFGRLMGKIVWKIKSRGNWKRNLFIRHSTISAFLPCRFHDVEFLSHSSTKCHA